MPSKSIDEVLRDTKIYQIQRPKLVDASSAISVREAIALMQKEKAGYVILTEPDGKVAGMFTERDVLMKIMEKNIALEDPVEKYMTRDPQTIARNESVGHAINMMEKFGVRHVPLTDENGQLCGVLSIRTVVNFLSELFPTEVFNLPPKPDQIHDTVEGG